MGTSKLSASRSMHILFIMTVQFIRCLANWLSHLVIGLNEEIFILDSPKFVIKACYCCCLIFLWSVRSGGMVHPCWLNNYIYSCIGRLCTFFNLIFCHCHITCFFLPLFATFLYGIPLEHFHKIDVCEEHLFNLTMMKYIVAVRMENTYWLVVKMI